MANVRLRYFGLDYSIQLNSQMVESQSFLAELEDAVSKGTAESCLRALWHATDILIAGTYSEEQIWAFGEIIGRLAEVIELSTRIRLANKLAPSSNAPSKVINKLASDDSIDVAGPVLRQSERLDVETLIASARTKGQQHLLAISKRKSVQSQRMAAPSFRTPASCTWCGARKRIPFSPSALAFAKTFPGTFSIN